MIDSLLQMGLSNACLSLALAIVATAVAATKRPHLAHLLWLLVFVKLVTPPILSIPVITITEHPPAVAVSNGPSPSPVPMDGADSTDRSNSVLPVLIERPTSVPHACPVPPETHALTSESGQGAGADAPEETNTAHAVPLRAHLWSVVRFARPWLVFTWFLGSVVVLVWSLIRVYRFNRVLAAGSEDAPQRLQAVAAEMARRLKVSKVPTICITSARISPLVWWTGGDVRIVVPETLIREMDEEQWQWVVAHELAHVRRRDHLVRWIEWLACAVFWWNPVVWWAQRNLREAEEICCDALVMSSLKPKPYSYANSLLTAVESIACPAIRPPAMASEINSGGFLERRFRMIISGTPNRVNSRWLRACVLLCAMAVLPFGMAYAHDRDAVQRRLGEAVTAGELSIHQAAAMMSALDKTAEEEEPRKEGDAKEESRKDEPRNDGWVGPWLKSLGNPLKEAVAKGELSEEQAWAKWHDIKEKVIAPKLKGAVKSGDLAEDKAWAIWHGIEKHEIAARLKSAVEKGEMTEEAARARWAEINKEPAEEKDKPHDEGIKPVPAEIAQAIGAALLKEAPMKFDGVPDKAVGWFAGDEEEDRLGMILVPARGYIDEDKAPELKVNDSAPLALLFTSPNLVPVSSHGKTDRGKIHTVTLADEKGKKHHSNCIPLHVKRISEDDYRLYGIGKATAPLIDARFTEGQGPGGVPFAMEVKDVDEESKTGTLVITLFNKYQVAFRAGVVE